MKKNVSLFIAVFLFLGSHNIIAQSKLSVESFEAEVFPPEGWTKITGFGGTGWQRGEVGSQIVGFDAGSLFDAPPNGENFVAYTSWATGDADGSLDTGQPTDQWLVTPQITDVQTADTLRFHLRYFSEFGDTLDVLISTSGNNIEAFDTVVDTLSFVGEGNNEWTSYSYALTDFVAPGSDIFVAFREHVANTSVEGDALFLDLVEVSSMVTSVAENRSRPGEFQLHQNYPNPFNPATNIVFSLPQTAEVTLQVYDILGRHVAIPIKEVQYEAGQHRILFEAGNLANGIYVYKLEAIGRSGAGQKYVETRKMLLIR